MGAKKKTPETGSPLTPWDGGESRRNTSILVKFLATMIILLLQIS